jgi:predicted phosphohydrolase
MRVFAIGDLHLEGGSGKTMDRFGPHWVGHDRKIFEAWEAEGLDTDLMILAGDITWATRLPEAVPDLERIGRMKGRKLMIKGNHDYWWDSKAKLQKALPSSILPLQSESLIIDRIAVAGSRGWLCPGDPFFQADDEKIYQREVRRVKLALETLSGRQTDYDRLIVALHYPPVNAAQEPSGFTELIDQWGAEFCVYGHLHGESTKTALTGLRGKTTYRLVSADYVDFKPQQIM